MHADIIQRYFPERNVYGMIQHIGMLADELLHFFLFHILGPEILLPPQPGHEQGKGRCQILHQAVLLFVFLFRLLLFGFVGQFQCLGISSV